jgi:penicillin-binding protein 2
MFITLKRFINKLKNKSYQEVDPDLIFLDSKNLPEFNTYQFEGRLERPISKKSFYFFYAFCVIVAIIFISKISYLQIVNGVEYKERSENNKLKKNLIVAPRGLIYSRDGQLLAWNQNSELDGQNENVFPLRNYTSLAGFGNLLGFVKYPAKDKAGFYYEEEYLPKDGAELYLNEMLRGQNGSEFIETTVGGNVVSKSVADLPRSGMNATLSVDARVQAQFYKIIHDLATSENFQGGAGVIMDIHSGEILAMTSFPEYDPQVMTNGSDAQKIKSYFNNPNNPFLNRVISGLYTPGSIVKPFVAFAAPEDS